MFEMIRRSHAVSLTMLLAATLCLGGLLAPVNDAGAAEKPNFVIIMADDLGYGDISCYDGWIDTPHIDALAKGGMKFTDFHSSGAVCSPTRAGLMTGRYQQRAGIPGVVYADPKREQHEHGLQTSETTFAELLKQAGYATGMFGKWHLGYYPKYNPVHHGFDEYVGYVSGNIDFFSHVDQAGALDWWKRDKIDDEPGYVTHLINDYSVDFIARHKDRPFCLYVPHEAPHYPYQGPNDKAFRAVGKGTVKQRMSKAEIKQKYKEMVVEMDKGVGQIVAALKEHGLENNTLVMFFSDNGGTGHGSNGPLRGTKGTVWEGGHRVSCVAYWPGKIEAGSETDAMTITLDIMPTLLALAGAETPSDLKLDGVDISGVMLRGETIKDRKLFFEHGGQQAMRDGPWKLVRNARGQKAPALYNLATDIGEKTDVSAEHAARFKQMQEALAAWQRDVETGATPQPSK